MNVCMYVGIEQDRVEQGGHNRLHRSDGRSGEKEGADLPYVSIQIHTYIHAYIMYTYIYLYLLTFVYTFEQANALKEKDYDVLDLIQNTIAK